LLSALDVVHDALHQPLTSVVTGRSQSNARRIESAILAAPGQNQV
jgi:hypothetical protein